MWEHALRGVLTRRPGLRPVPRGTFKLLKLFLGVGGVAGGVLGAGDDLRAAAPEEDAAVEAAVDAAVEAAPPRFDAAKRAWDGPAGSGRMDFGFRTCFLARYTFFGASSSSSLLETISGLGLNVYAESSYSTHLNLK